MSRSESAYKDVAEELRRIRPRVMAGDASAIDNAVDLLISAHYFLVEDDYDEKVISVESLTSEQRAEFDRRWSFPFECPQNIGIQVESIDFDNMPRKPIYDKSGRLIGTAAEIIELPGACPLLFPKGGEA